MENKRLIISVGSPIAGGTVDSVFGRTGNVIAVNGDYTTSLVTESTDKKYVTDAEKTVLSNTSGTNTGDETTSTIQTKRPLKNVNGESLEGTGDIDINKSDVGLGNVDNTSDADKPVSNATQTALDGKEDSITAGTTVQYFRGDKTFQTLDKTSVGLGNVDNTSDLDKPISTATQTALDGKVAIATNPSKTVKGAIKAFYDTATSTLEISIDGTDIA